MDWDELRFFRAVADSGSVRGAALELEVNPSTVTRRLEQLETRLGVRLFVRRATGLAITEHGAAMAAAVDEVAQKIEALTLSVSGADAGTAGTVNLSLPDVFLHHTVLGALGGLLLEFPELKVRCQSMPHAADDDALTVSVRLTDTPPPQLIGRPFRPLCLGVYASRQHTQTEDCWVEVSGLGDLDTRGTAIKAAYFPEAQTVFAADLSTGGCAAIKAGMGVGVLPCFVGEADPELIRVQQVPMQSGPMVWILSHPQLRGVRRAQVVIDKLREIFAERSFYSRP